MRSKLIPLVLVSSFVVAGCASAPPTKSARQYCYTSQEIKTRNNEKVDSQTTVSCNDDPIERIPSKAMGISPKCFENPYRHVLPSGRIIQGMTYACQKRDGTWESIDGDRLR
ncbi:MAG: hypothetical protein RL373_1114 [Pseudomonadota bacterium]|jgi:hypothetical protein